MIKQNENMPKVSIIVPVFKAEKYLRECVDSILNQKFQDWTLLLVDDGSPDCSGKICDDYAQKDKRIQVIHKPNGGVSSARNYALELVESDWLTFVDADDCLYSNALYRMISIAEKDQVDFIQCSFNRVFEEGQHDGSSSGVLSANDYVFFSYMGTHVWGSFFKTSIVQNNNLRFDTNVRLGEDQMFVLDYLLHTQKVCYIGEKLYFYRDNNESAVHNTKLEYEIESIKAFKALKKRNPLANRQSDNMLFRWFLSLSLNKEISAERIINLYKDVTLSYCSPNHSIVRKIVFRLYGINHIFAIYIIYLIRYLKGL